jgi:hypothetical protein
MTWVCVSGQLLAEGVFHNRLKELYALCAGLVQGVSTLD